MYWKYGDSEICSSAIYGAVGKKKTCVRSIQDSVMGAGHRSDIRRMSVEV
jgi:hypothetical protein